VATDSGTPLKLSDAAVKPLRTLDPAAALDDLEWLDETIGTARVVAIGESAHGVREFYELRHRLLRYLVERHGFDAYAMESGFVEGWGVNDWVHGGDDQLSAVLATGVTFLMGLFVPMRTHLEWMREHNRSAARPVAFYGVDLPGSCASLVPGIDAVIAYLGQADPALEVDPSIRETAAAWAGNPMRAPASFAAYKDLPSTSRNALTAGLAELAARMMSRRLDYGKQTGIAAYQRALQSLRVTVNLDAALREMTRDPQGETVIRDATMAQTVEWIADRHDRIVVAAHNAHIQRGLGSVAGVSSFTPMGMHLADQLGDDYLVIGTTCGTGRIPPAEADIGTGKMFTELEAPQPGSRGCGHGRQPPRPLRGGSAAAFARRYHNSSGCLPTAAGAFVLQHKPFAGLRRRRSPPPNQPGRSRSHCLRPRTRGHTASPAQREARPISRATEYAIMVPRSGPVGYVAFR
jgi:erythromycin esterase